MKLIYKNFLNPLARRLRRAGIVSEAILWNELKGKKLGVRFLRQRPIGSYIVDFYCHSLSLAIEIDGGATHNNRVNEDLMRQNELQRMGVKFLRFQDVEVKHNLNKVVENIKLTVEGLMRGGEKSSGATHHLL